MVHNSIIRLFITAAAAACCAGAAFAIPATPTPVRVSQSDGTTITVRLVGDEHFHYALSPDGFPLIECDGVYRYAQLGTDGSVVPSAMKASDPEKRSAAEITMLSTTNSKAVIGRLEANRSARMAIYKKECAARRKAPENLRFGDFVVEGSPKMLVVLVEFEDVKFNNPDARNYISRMLNEKGFSDYGATGSAIDYFSTCSSGKYTPQFTVVGPVKLNQNLAYYGGNSIMGKDTNAHYIISEALELIDPEIDFNEYDNNHNGTLDGVFIIHAGEGEATGGPAWSIWPHCSWFTTLETKPYIYDGVRLDTYAIANEWENGHPGGAGVFIHEFCHVMGLPDMYTGDQNILTPGSWTVMDMGSHSNERRTPPLYSSFERYAMNWLEPRQLDERDNITIRPIAENDGCMIQASDEELFFFENRQQTGWDKYLPGHGMLVWHVDYNKDMLFDVNGDPDHQHIDIVEADGILTKDTREGDSFPGTAGVTAFGDDTTPSIRSWSGRPLNTPLTEITENDGLIRFKVKGGFTEIAIPEAPTASELTPTGFTLAWSPVENAVDYKVTVRRADGEGDALSALTGGATTFSTEGKLDESTTYLCGIQSVGADGFISESSQETEVTTPEMSFVFTRPTALDGTVNTDGSFTAAWEPLAEADSYELSVWGVKEGEPFSLIQDFADGATLSDGWQQNGCVAMANDAYSGAARPSLKMAPDAWLQTPALADDIKHLSLWLRGISPKEGAEIEVDALCGGEWILWNKIDASDNTGHTVTLDNPPSGSRALRFTFRSSGGSVAVDDLNILWGAEEVLQPEAGFAPVKVAGESLKVTPTSGLLKFYYSVTGLSGNLRSLPSERIAVALPATVNPVTSDGTVMTIEGRTITAHGGNATNTLEIADIAGRVIVTHTVRPGQTVSFTIPAPGLYLLRCGNHIAKTIFK